VILCHFRYVPAHDFVLQLKFPNFLHRGVK
jgi:hypothetical protein